ncbi:MAG: Hsp20/alpha crystallin family protein, partial [Candidatus Latescibacterota bacterium]
MDRFFEDFLRGSPLARFGFDDPALLGSPMPRVDLRETDEAFEVGAEPPGMDADDIDLSVTRDTLTLRGERR